MNQTGSPISQQLPLQDKSKNSKMSSNPLLSPSLNFVYGICLLARDTRSHGQPFLQITKYVPSLLPPPLFPLLTHLPCIYRFRIYLCSCEKIGFTSPTYHDSIHLIKATCDFPSLIDPTTSPPLQVSFSQAGYRKTSSSWAQGDRGEFYRCCAGRWSLASGGR